MKVSLISFCFFALFLILTCYSASAELFGGYANLSTTWTNNEALTNDSTDNNLILRPILSGRNFGREGFACGFLYNRTNMLSYQFVIFVAQIFWYGSVEYIDHMYPEVVIWSANPDHEVGNGAILNFTSAGELVLQDVDGSIVWTTNTRGKSVVGMNLTDSGNLVLFDVSGSVVWQSFDYPTDCLVLGQRLYQGQQLVPSVSSTNSTDQKGIYSLQVTDKGLFAYVGSNPPLIYSSYLGHGKDTNEGRSYVRFLNGSLAYLSSAEPDDPEFVISIPQASLLQFIKLMPNGHLELIDLLSSNGTADILTNDHGECGYPLVCGRNGLCLGDQQCTCPTTDYFKPVNDNQPELGCSEITPLTCDSKQDQDFIKLHNVMYFTHRTYTPDMETLNMETCKQACLNDCSCKAVLFWYDSYISKGYCYLPSELFSMFYVDPSYNATAFIKVQKVRPASLSPTSHQVSIVIGSTIGSFVLLVVLSVGIIIFIVRKRIKNADREEDYLDQVPGMPARFSYEELQTATENFSKKLGEGGFGSVFEGILEDDSKIAVKCLDGLGQVKNSFLAEVESIGSIHHVNLVRLRGFCAWKSERLLVYEFMSNGSLDRWIYHGDREHILEWACRKKIILDIAKGLAYLHEDCRQKIIHLDIKPQNILLDEDFNAKVSDFGLSKLLDRNQAQVMTTRVKGTPGYIAPEWWSSVITEKVDVFSFGVVLLEILCGRKVFDRSLQEESWYLLSVFQRGWEQGVLLDMVDRYSEDMQAHGTEVVEMMKVASWCLQTDFARRPSMSSVIKVLEGVKSVESNLDYNFTDPRMQTTSVKREEDWTQLLPSRLSGPR